MPRTTPRRRALPAVLLAAVTVAAGLAATAAPAAAAPPANLVTNGSFETGTVTPWAQWPAGRAVVLTGTAGRGAPAAGDRFAGYPANSSLAQTVTGLKPNQHYIVTGSVRADASATSFSVGLRYHDAGHPNVVESEKQYARSTGWTRIDLPFRTGPSHTQVNLLSHNSAATGAGYGYLDDVRLYELSADRVSIQDNRAAAADIPQEGSDPELWAALQDALTAADVAYWNFAAADADVARAADDLDAALRAFEEPPPDGIVSPGDTTYYVSSSTGGDDGDGLSPETAWRSLAMVNASTFAPGDQILLRGGDRWEGTTLQPRGSGTPGAPITLGRYGPGDARPFVNAQDDRQLLDTFNLVKGNDPALTPYTQEFYASVFLYNQQHWVIRDLEVSNHAAGFTDANGDARLRTGILVMNDGAGTLRDVEVRDTYVHDVLGSRSEKTYWGGAGILFTVMLKAPGAAVASNFDGVRIEGNYVRRTNRQGIVTNSRQNLRPDIDHVGDLQGAVDRGLSPWFPSTDVVIRDNYVKDVAGDGILPQVTEGALIERNTVDGFNQRSGGAAAGIWAWNADHTVFQFNEAFGGMTTQDGQGYDLDYGQTGTVFQYNYSHDNQGGFMLVCSPGQGSNESGPGSGVTSQDGVVRYNVSQNDRARTFMFSGYSDGTLIYNNTVYQGPGINARPVDFWAWNLTYPTSASFYNNVFHLDSAGPWNYADRGYTMRDVVFVNNTVFGVHTAGEPADPGKSTADPRLVAPGTGTTRTAVGGAYAAPDLDGYRLAPGSPAIGTGAVVETTSGRTIGGTAANGGRDHWGNPVHPGVAPNRGADNAGAPSMSFDLAAALVGDSGAESWQVTRMLGQLEVAARLAGDGRTSEAGRALDRYRSVAEAVADDMARDRLVTAGDALKAQLE